MRHNTRTRRKPPENPSEFMLPHPRVIGQKHPLQDGRVRAPMIDGRLRVYARGSSPLCGLALPAPPAGKQDQLSSTGCRARRARSSYPCMHEARKSFVSEVERLHHRTQHGGGSYVLWARRHLHQAGAESWCSAPEPSILKALVGRRSASDIRHH